MNLLLSMSLAGSLVYLVYLILRPLAVKYFSSTWRYRLLKLSLVFYLLPYQYYKFRYYGILYPALFHRQYRDREDRDGIRPYNMDTLVYVDVDGHYSIKNEKMIVTILAVWCIAVLSFVVYQIVKYVSCRKMLRQISDVPDSDSDMVLEQCREKLHMRKKVGLFCKPHMEVPFAIGVFSPCIILPEKLKEEETLRMAMLHELTHIRNHDILIKFLALFVLILHWYNPMAYFLYWEICRTGEQVCDEVVTQGMSQEEKEAYQELIINTAQKDFKKDIIFTNALSSDFKILKERIDLMKRTSVISSKFVRIVSFVVAVLLLAMSPLPVMAYDPWEKGISKSPDDYFRFEGEHYFVHDGTNFDYLDEYDPFLKLGTSQDVFVDDDGVPSVVYETGGHTERLTCNHIWENGKYYTHIDNNDGSCTVYIYVTKKCSLCGVYEKGERYGSIHYTKCPH